MRASLDEHVAGDVTEADNLARMVELCESIADPFSRTSYTPGHFTASAFIVSPAGDALLLIHHHKLQRWLQPGGHVDASDGDLHATALREIHEEVGLHEHNLEPLGLLDVDIHDIPPRKTEPAHAHFDVRYLFRARTLAHRAGSDAEAARWVKRSEITPALTDVSVLRAVAKLDKLLT